MRKLPHLSTKRTLTPIFNPSKPLVGLGCGVVIGILTLGSASAQVISAPATPADSDTLPADANAQNSNSQQQVQPPVLIPSNNLPATAPSSNNPSLIFNPTGPYNPLNPSQAANGGSNVQAPQLTTPTLYTTGSNDISQIATYNALSQAFTDTSAMYSDDPGMSFSHPPIERVRLGPLDLKAALSTNITSDDNLQIGNTAQGQKISDTFYTVTPAILLQYGQHDGQKGSLDLTYAPSIQRYLHHSEQDNDDQNVVLTAQYPFQRLTLQGGEVYEQGTGVNQDTNTRTQQSTQVSTIGATYEVDDKISVGAHFQETSSRFSSGQGDGEDTTSINTNLSYRLSDKLTIGPSLNVGQEKPQMTQKSTYEQALVGGFYQPTEKITANIQAGLEFRQYDGGGDSTDPIFAAGVGYRPFDSTTLSLNAYQNQRSSQADGNQTVTTASVGVAATQRFFQRFYLTLSASYEHDDYKQGGGNNNSGGGGNLPDYSQNSFVYRPSLAFNPTAWTSVDIYYQYQENKSGGPTANYHDNQVGLSVTAQF